ncbi:MAG: sulfotransferase [Pseudomonadota bacterium]
MTAAGPAAPALKPEAARHALEAVDESLRARDFAEAMRRMQTLESMVPDDYGIRFAAAQLALRIEEPRWAYNTLTHLASLTPPTWQAAVGVVDMLRTINQSAAARRLFAQLREQFPDEALLRAREGDLKVAVGETGAAREHYAAALAQDPSLTSVYLFFSRDPESDPAEWLARIDGVDAELTRVQLANLKVARGRCCERLGDVDDAFKAFSEGRQLLADPRASEQLSRQIAEAPAYAASFDPERLKDLRAAGDVSASPIFIAGMPRSGSTLLAQLLGAHPDVVNLGERGILATVLSAQLAAQPGDTLESLAQGSAASTMAREYRRRAEELAAHQPGARRRIDKMPFNFSLIPVARVLFPRATLLHTVRAPGDVAWSMFSAAFSLPALLLSLEDIGRLHALHDFLMAQWAERLGEQAPETVTYETLVAEPQKRLRALLAKAGLGWSDEISHFHRAGNEVLTSSDLQVRQPIHRNAVGRSKAYAAHLTPFFESRETTGRELEALAAGN